MTLVVLLVLAVLWAVVLVPPLLRARTDRSSDSIGDFNHRLGVLGRTNGAAPAPEALVTPFARGSMPRAVPPRMPVGVGAVPPRRGAEWAAKRRRDVVQALVGTAAATLALAYVSGIGALWALHIAVDVALLTYLGLWAWLRGTPGLPAIEHADGEVHYLPPPRMPDLALRRTASS